MGRCPEELEKGTENIRDLGERNVRENHNHNFNYLQHFVMGIAFQNETYHRCFN